MAKNPQSDLVQPNERIDDLQNGFYVIQNPEKFCFGMDAVLLSGFANIRKNETVLDTQWCRQCRCPLSLVFYHRTHKTYPRL